MKTGYDYLPKTSFAPDGSAYETFELAEQYAMISKYDYIKSRENFRFIETEY